MTITYLEMRSPDALRPKRLADPKLRFFELKAKQWEFNRSLYLRVGRDWSWTDKQHWSENQWREYVDTVRTIAADYDGTVAGYYELRPDSEGGVEIAIFGVTPEFTGRGIGGALLTNALEEAWAARPLRVWLHTCTLDHPGALPNYLARGMTIYRVDP